jgi:hypothetical protein
MLTRLLKFFGIYPIRVALHLKSGTVLRRDCDSFTVSKTNGTITGYECTGGKPGGKILYLALADISAIVIERQR